MADQVTEQKTTPTDPPPEVVVPPVETPPPTTQVAPVESTTKPDDGKVLQVKHSDFKKIKDESREHGRREALAELDAAAMSAGFESHADAIRALGELKKSAAPPPTAPKPAPPETTQMPKQPDKKDERAADKAARESQRLSDERSKLRKDWKSSERKLRDARRQLDNKEAEMHLREEAYRSGLQDVDFGLRLLTRELAGKSAEEMAKFDRKAFFEDLRAKRPYLFGEKVEPATTGTHGTKPDGSQPPAPPAGKPTVDAARGTQFDARTATREQYEEHLRKLGLNPHMTGP